jgi:type II protein arginine methyltransferase
MVADTTSNEIPPPPTAEMKLASSSTVAAAASAMTALASSTGPQPTDSTTNSASAPSNLRESSRVAVTAATGGTPSPPQLVSPFVVGLSIPSLQQDAEEHLTLANNDGFDYCTTMLPSLLPGIVNGVVPVSTPSIPRRDVVALNNSQWRTSVVGILPYGGQFSLEPDGEIESKYCFELWNDTMNWAFHYNLPAVILPPIPHNHDVEQYASTLYAISLKAAAARTQLWIPVRLTNSNDDLVNIQRVLQQCHYSSSIHVMIDLDNSHPTSLNSGGSSDGTKANGGSTGDSTPAAAAVLTLAQQELQFQMLHVLLGSAHVAAIRIRTRTFLTNKRGYPALSKQVQLLFAQILIRVGRTVKWLLAGQSVHPIPPGESNASWGVTFCKPYLDYLFHLRTTKASKGNTCIGDVLDSSEAALEKEYLDALQKPLQPLAHHLENGVYETFEKDPVKYTKYQQAIYQLAADYRTHQIQQYNTFVRSAPFLPQSGQLRSAPWVMVIVGAGRGPLVTCAINAWQRACLDVPVTPPLAQDSYYKSLVSALSCRIYAVEKNPSAVAYLKSLALFHPLWSQQPTPQAGGAGSIPIGGVHGT